MRQEKYLYIDLYGKSVQEAKKLLNEKFTLVKEENYTEFYIITGRGNHAGPGGIRGVLRKALPRLLKPYCEDILSIDAEAGAYKILLKKDATAMTQLLKAMNTFAVGSDDPKDHLAYFKKVETSAETGNTAAMLLIANIYFTGEMKEFDNKEKALSFLKRAKEKQSSRDVQTELGVMQMEGRYLEKNYEAGLDLLKTSAEQGDAIAAFWLAKYYTLGQGVKQSDQEALFWMEKSADQNYPMAEFNLGYSYLEGKFTPKDNKQAFHYLKKAAVHGHLEAKTHLAHCHAGGYGTRVDHQEAFRLYQEAAAFNEPDAIYQTGLYYQRGHGVTRDDKEALRYFLQGGAELNDANCQVKLAEIYFFGVGVDKDPATGFQWAQRSAAQKNSFGYYTLFLAYWNGWGTSVDLAKADQYLKMAAENGCANAQFALGISIIKNNPANIEAGIKWLQKAAEYDHRQAIEMLEALHESLGFGVTPPQSPDATPVSLLSTYPQTIYPKNKESSGKIQKTSAASGKKLNEKEDKSPTYSGLRRGFLLGGQ
jgi:TPR repeat protein